MKFSILDASGHKTLTVEGEQAETKFLELKEQGFKALTKEGKEIDDIKEIPDTVEELIFGKKVKYSGKRGT